MFIIVIWLCGSGILKLLSIGMFHFEWIKQKLRLEVSKENLGLPTTASGTFAPKVVLCSSNLPLNLDDVTSVGSQSAFKMLKWNLFNFVRNFIGETKHAVSVVKTIKTIFPGARYTNENFFRVAFVYYFWNTLSWECCPLRSVFTHSPNQTFGIFIVRHRHYWNIFGAFVSLRLLFMFDLFFCFVLLDLFCCLKIFPMVLL